MPEPPTGTLSFLFTDIVGSSRLWEKFPGDMGMVIARHDTIVRDAVETRGGYVFKTVGDAFCVAFPTALAAMEAAVAAQLALAAEDWTPIEAVLVRMGIHTGAAELRGGDYFGGTLNRAARIEAAAHGGQVLLSQLTVTMLSDDTPHGYFFKPLGEHRLRGLERPEHLHQVIAEGLMTEFPPPRSVEIIPNNLPVQATSFIGREKEMAEAHRLMQSTRLLTLTGTGGTGKTRLAVEMGLRAINDHPDGVWMVELVPVTEGSRVVEAVAAALGAREEPERPLLDTLINFLRSKNLLLLLDNCEHVLAGVAPLAAALLRACPELQILATSRHSLGIAGETTLPVPPLGNLETRGKKLLGTNLVARLMEYDAVRLFVARATAVRPDFTVTEENAPALAEICNRLDGIPLAIELAAARARLLSVEQIAERLDDRFRLLRGGDRAGMPHQQTLQALIDWSYDLLTEPERALFRRLGVFIVGRTLEAIEEVCSGDGVDEDDVLDLLQQLVDKSLITVERDSAGSPRYTLIESVWQYAQTKLEEAGERKKTKDRHLDFFLRLIEKAAPLMEGSEQMPWIEKMNIERYNFRNAVSWALESERIEEGLRLIAALERPLEIRGDLTIARGLYEPILAHPKAAEKTPQRADALEAAARLSWAQDRYEDARRYYTEAISVYESNGLELQASTTKTLMGFLDRGDGRVDEAEARFRHGLEVGLKHNETRLIAIATNGLGSIAQDRGNLAEARRLKEESVITYQKLGDRWILGLIIWGVCRVAIAQRDIPRAREAIAQWADIMRDFNNQWMLSYILQALADTAMVANQPRQAARLYGAAEKMREHFGSQFSVNEQKEHDQSMQHLHEALAADLIDAAWKKGAELDPWEAVHQAIEDLSDEVPAHPEHGQEAQISTPAVPQP